MTPLRSKAMPQIHEMTNMPLKRHYTSAPAQALANSRGKRKQKLAEPTTKVENWSPSKHIRNLHKQTCMIHQPGRGRSDRAITCGGRCRMSCRNNLGGPSRQNLPLHTSTCCPPSLTSRARRSNASKSGCGTEVRLSMGNAGGASGSGSAMCEVMLSVVPCLCFSGLPVFTRLWSSGA